MFMLFIVLMIRINLRKVKTFLCEKQSCVNYKELLLAGAGVSKVKYLMVKITRIILGKIFLIMS